MNRTGSGDDGADSPLTRRRLLLAAGVGTALGVAGCSQSAAPSEDGSGRSDGADGSESGPTDATGSTTGSHRTTDDGGGRVELPASVGLRRLAGGFRAPVALAFAPDAQRSYVADQSGVVSVVAGGTVRDEPFLDLRESVSFGGEKGLLGITLHPEFAEDRRLFVRYSAPRREGTPSNYGHTFVLAEFEASADGLRTDPGSERTVLEIPQPQSNHNAGDLAFGPDGYLYVAVGDGGGGGDRGTGHADDWYGTVPGGNGQDVTENLLGSVLRIDVDREGPKGRPYAVPDDNPLVDREGLDEHYAWGLRNPWRMGFDGDDLHVADVGQNAYEEVDLVEKGSNYGWNVREGTHCFGADDCPDRTPADVRGSEPLRGPVIEYPHSGGDVSGISVIGGNVYRGSSVPGLGGTYVFGDLQADGRLFVATPEAGAARGEVEGDGLWPTRVLDVADGDRKLERVLSIARDGDGELYVLGTGREGGAVYRIAPLE
jgi:glucose/arabinose dehydrogenase